MWISSTYRCNLCRCSHGHLNVVLRQAWKNVKLSFNVRLVLLSERQLHYEVIGYQVGKYYHYRLCHSIQLELASL